MCLHADHLLAEGGFQTGERGMQPGVKDDRCTTSHSRLLQSASMDISRGSPEWMNTDIVGHQGPAAKSIMKRNYSTATPFRQQPWSPLYYNNAQPICGSERRTSIAIDAGSLEESFADSSSQRHEFSTPSRVPFEGSSTSLTANESFYRRLETPEHLLYPECEVLSHTSIEMEISPGSCTSVQTSPMDSSTGFSSNEVKNSDPHQA